MSERPQPSPEHAHAVAVVLAQANGTEWDLMPGDDDVYRRDARAILASDDPAVHAALLAALTRAGVLTETWAIRDEDGVIWLDAHSDSRGGSGMEFTTRAEAEEFWCGYDELETVERRFVTPWSAQDGPVRAADAPEAPGQVGEGQ